MKKVFFVLFLILLSTNVYALEVKLSKCVDGDTAKFKIDNEIVSVRFLAIDTKEINTEKGKVAASYTCKILKSAKIIELEYDKNSDKTDKYGRHLAWIFVDGKLLQQELVKKGFAEVKYIFGDYKYTNLLVTNDNNFNILSIVTVLLIFMSTTIFIIKRKQKIKTFL